LEDYFRLPGLPSDSNILFQSARNSGVDFHCQRLNLLSLLLGRRDLLRIAGLTGQDCQHAPTPRNYLMPDGIAHARDSSKWRIVSSKCNC